MSASTSSQAAFAQHLKDDNHRSAPSLHSNTERGGEAASTSIPRQGSSCRCISPGTGRNLVVCIDGTANQFSRRNTHVVELYSRLMKDAKQQTYYNSGIGTFVKDSNWWGRSKQFVIHTWDMMVAWNLKKIVLRAYQWLSENYQPGDRIFLFGFSRGAYQVRIIAGMIEIVGLLHKGNNDQIPFAYELYVANTADTGRNVPVNTADTGRNVPVGTASGTPSTTGPKERRREQDDTSALCKKFKETLSHKNATVHFVGVWDTVSSVGITRGPTLPETTTGMRHVCVVRHALALDEKRVKFLPEFVNGGSGPLDDEGNVKEVWFPGSHSDIGGGNAPNPDLNKFGPPLRWMVNAAMEHGLRMEAVQGNWVDSQYIPSMSPFYQVLEYFPIKRLSYTNPVAVKRWPPHHSGGRHIQPRQLIHRSVLAYMQEHPDYRPAASLPLGSAYTWREIQQRVTTQSMKDVLESMKDIVEQDQQDQVSVEVEALLSELGTIMETSNMGSQAAQRGLTRFVELAPSSLARQSVVDYPGAAKVLMQLLAHISEQSGDIDFQPREPLLTSIAASLAGFDSSPSGTPVYPSRVLRTWLYRVVPKEHCDKISRVFSVMKGHTGWVQSVAFSPDGAYIASASDDNTIRLWDARTFSPVGEPLCGHRGGAYSVVFAPNSARIASGGGIDGTVRIWDVQTLRAVGEPLRGHEGAVWSVAFASDGKTIASGSWDGTIRLWDAATGGAVREPFSEHEGPVFSVVFAHNDTRLVSGSADKTIRIWNIETREVFNVLKGHTNAVLSIAVSHDGTRIVSGSADNTIRMWDAETGQAVGDTIRGHTDTVWSVAFSPDDRYVVSGSGDETVRLWRADNGEAVGEPLRGHRSSVRSVAFSPDGKRIVSGSRDGTLRIW